MEAATQLLDVIDSDQTVSLDTTGDDGRTIFPHAVMLGKDKPIWELINTLKKNYKIEELQNILDREDRKGRTPLLLAIKRKSPKVVKLLLNEGVVSDGANHRNQEGLSALSQVECR